MNTNIQDNQTKQNKVVCMYTCIRLILLSILIFTVNTAGAAPVMTLGFHAHEPANIPAAASARYTTIRLWDTGTDWASIEPEQGVYNFDRIEEYLAASEKANLKVLWTIGNTPGWASARPDEECSYGLGCAAEPRDINDWRDYVRTIANKFKGRIECYEVWNEVSFPYDPLFSNDDGGDPNLFFSGNVSDMVELTRVAYEEIKQADPNACVLSPSFHYGGNWAEKFDRFLEAGGGQYIDVVSQHFYFDPEPENAVPIIRAMKAVLAKNNLSNLPMWNTEVGMTFPDEAALRPKLSIEEVVYSLTLRSYLLNKSEEVSRVYWYAWDNGDMGIQNPDLGFDYGSEAVKAAVHLLDNLKSVQCSSSKNLWQCKVEAGGRQFKVAWLSGINATPRSFVLTGNATRWDNVSKSFLAGQTISLDARPVIINGW